MSNEADETRLAAELTRFLAARFPGITIEVVRNERWDRPCLTFHWADFAELLPEERFRRLVEAIPEDFRTERLGGFVWLELAPHETVEAFLNLPRSEDVADSEARICSGLTKVGFFDALAELLGKSPDKTCRGDFSGTATVLADKDYSSNQTRDAKLVFIRHGAYCDCQVLQSVHPALAKLHTGVA